MARLRLASQILFLILFILLFAGAEYRGNDQLGISIELLPQLNPLVLFSSVISLHRVADFLIPGVFLSLFLILVTLFLGRIFCGWICPLGTTFHGISFIAEKTRNKKSAASYRPTQKFKYYFLAFLLITAFFSTSIVGIFDPISIFLRSLTVAVNPMINYGFRAFFDALYETDIGLITGISEPAYSFLKDHYLSFHQPLFRFSWILLLFFLILAGLNFVIPRFWCRFICPLGALLGLFSRWSWLRRVEKTNCRKCGLCESPCMSGAEPGSGEEAWRPSECFMCMDCNAACPDDAVKFRLTPPWKSKVHPIDLTKRSFLVSVASSFLLSFFLSEKIAGKEIQPKRIRPPGALEEEKFLDICIRCGACMKICPTNAVQPSLIDAGIRGIWTPILVPRIGYCEYNCTLCGQICPTGALQSLTKEEKKKNIIGKAFIDKNICIPYARGIPCIVCEEHCPVSPKAIWFKKDEIVLRNGRKKTLFLPEVEYDRCIGCGICENKCPLKTRAAIRVVSEGESRSEKEKIIHAPYPQTPALQDQTDSPYPPQTYYP